MSRFLRAYGKYLIIILFAIVLINILNAFVINTSLIVLLYLYFVAIVFFVIHMYATQGFYIKKGTLNSEYGNIEIVDCVFLNYRKNFREMRVDGVSGAYSKINLKAPEKLQFYQYCEDVVNFLFANSCERILVLGGGGCGVPIFLATKYRECTVEVVEISPEVIKASIEYFIKSNYYQNNIAFINEDALNYVQSTSQKYEFVFCDLFIGDKIPSFVFTKAFIKNLYNLLLNNGAIVVNMGNARKNNICSFIEVCKTLSIKANIYTHHNSIVLIMHKNKLLDDKQIYSDWICQIFQLN